VIAVERDHAQQFEVVGQHAHIIVDHMQDYSLATVPTSHTDVHQSRVVPDGDFASLIDDVATHAVARRVLEPSGSGFIALAIGDGWCPSTAGAMRANLVVVLDELIEVAL